MLLLTGYQRVRTNCTHVTWRLAEYQFDGGNESFNNKNNNKFFQAAAVTPLSKPSLEGGCQCDRLYKFVVVLFRIAYRPCSWYPINLQAVGQQEKWGQCGRMENFPVAG